MVIKIGFAAAALLLLASAPGAAMNPEEVQDPPGRVDVNQPGDVALDERNTERDATDTLRGGRTEVIERSSAGEASAGTQWRSVDAGAEVRASFDPADDAVDASTDSMPGTVYSDDSWLGTDLGYGVGTEPVEAAER